MRRPHSFLSCCVVALVGLSACATGASSAAPSTVAATLAPSTTSTTTSSTTTTSTTTTTTLPPLPDPLPAPDDGATEPVVELGTIEIPKIYMRQTLFEGVTEGTLDLGPGHWPGSAMPGELGNVVVGGHRTSKTRPFRHLDQLEAGDEVIFTTADGIFVYIVDRVEILLPSSTWILAQRYEYNATLFSCHPPGSIKERIVVFMTLLGT